MRGKVKFFNSEKGFGFITGEDNKDYFVHVTNVSEDLSLTDGLAVVFDVVNGDRGLKAINVTKE